MDCTFCLDCVKACPSDNVGILAVSPGSDLLHVGKRSAVGDYSRRPDLAALVLVLTFAAFANAAGMTAPALELEKKLSPASGLVFLAFVLLLPFFLASACTWLSLKCGAGAISKGETCHKGAGGGSGPTTNRYLGRGFEGGLSNTVHPYYAKRGIDPSSVRQVASNQAKVGAVAGTVEGAALGGVIGVASGLMSGKRGRSQLAYRAAKSALIGSGIGAAAGSGFGAVGGASEALGYKAGRGVRRGAAGVKNRYQAAQAQNAKIQASMAKLDPRHRAEMQRARTKGASRSEMQALRQKHAREVTQSLQRMGGRSSQDGMFSSTPSRSSFPTRLIGGGTR
jgi:hypothetical protein